MFLADWFRLAPPPPPGGTLLLFHCSLSLKRCYFYVESQLQNSYLVSIRVAQPADLAESFSKFIVGSGLGNVETFIPVGSFRELSATGRADELRMDCDDGDENQSIEIHLLVYIWTNEFFVLQSKSLKLKMAAQIANQNFKLLDADNIWQNKFPMDNIVSHAHVSKTFECKNRDVGHTI